VTLPTFSVVVPVYNGADTIEACVSSLLAQDYPADLREVIVVENGSTDGTAEVVGRLPVRLLRSELRGPAPARNGGWRAATADGVAFTDADCRPDRGWLRALAKVYANDATGAVGGVGGPIVAYAHAGRSVVEKFAEMHSPLNSFAEGARVFLPDLYTANASYRRRVLERVCGFDQRLVTGDDVDLAWRVQLHAECALAWAPDAIVQHHHRSTYGGLTRQYRQYGFGEVLLDTMYGRCAGYARTPARQLLRMLGQAAALPRYVLSGFVRQARYMLAARAEESDYQRSEPWLCLAAEAANLRGKCEALWQTRGMSDLRPVLETPPEQLVHRLFQHRKI